MYKCDSVAWCNLRTFNAEKKIMLPNPNTAPAPLHGNHYADKVLINSGTSLTIQILLI